MNRTHTIALVAALSALLAGAVQAQAVYRIVGPDGRVTFSDRAPEDLSKGAKVSTHVGVQTGTDLHANDALPFALRQTATRYPVVLYTGKDCGPCVNGRNLLINRGIPFAERTVTSNEDIEALQGLAGDASLPVVTIGSQRIKGFSDTEWSQYLDAAGYPKTSELPASYQRSAAAPLVVRGTPVVPSHVVPKPEPRQQPARTAPETPAPAAPAPGTPNPSNPAGIIF